MKIKLALILILAALCGWLPGRLIAKGSSPPAVSSLPSILKVDIGFERMRYDTMSVDGSGKWKVRGDVSLESREMSLSCQELDIDPEKKIMVAKGSPTRVKQANIEAECKMLTYYIDQKRSVFEKDAIIKKRDGDKLLVNEAHRITLVQTEKGSSLTFENNPRSGEQSELKVINLNPKEEIEKTPGDQKKNNGQKVNDKNLEIIKIPEID